MKKVQSKVKYILEDFIKQDFIGSGSFGKVYKVLEKKSSTIYAAKIINNYSNNDQKEMSIDISREVSILSKLDHPTVLKFIYFSPYNFKHKPKPTIITEYASNGSLQDYIEMERLCCPKLGWNDTRKLIVAYGISSAMSYLHKNNIIHRDLKPANILMDEFLLPKIADFGYSKANDNEKYDSLFQTFTNDRKGTPSYMSPEIWERNEYSEMSDVYAFGLILYEIFTGERLFENCYFLRIPLMLKEGYRPPFKKPIHSAYKNLIEKCWRQIPYSRPSFDQIVIELKNNKNFITESIDEDEFIKHVKYIDEYESSFGNSKLDHLFHRVKNVESKEFKKCIQFDLKFFPFDEFVKLHDNDSILLVHKAETNPFSQFLVGRSLIEGQYDFSRNVQLGIEYLLRSIENGCIESAILYIKMLIKGDIIPENHKKAKKFLMQN